MSDMDALIDGFKYFKGQLIEDGSGGHHDLFDYGPHSKILMIACCDSRVDPAVITSSSAGDLMVIRNVGNLVPPYTKDGQFKETQAAIEFAVCYLNIKTIIVMGHSRCGGIRSLLTRLLDDFDAEYPLDQWMAVAEPAARSVLAEIPAASLDDQACACSRRAVVSSLDNLCAYPWVAEGVERGDINVHGWYFNLADAELSQYNPGSKAFESLY
jgi:carbonic anhydrase